MLRVRAEKDVGTPPPRVDSTTHVNEIRPNPDFKIRHYWSRRRRKKKRTKNGPWAGPSTEGPPNLGPKFDLGSARWNARWALVGWLGSLRGRREGGQKARNSQAQWPPARAGPCQWACERPRSRRCWPLWSARPLRQRGPGSLGPAGQVKAASIPGRLGPSRVRTDPLAESRSLPASGVRTPRTAAGHLSHEAQ
jgi:hypothetical protein